ncbi:unnamed protein product [Polarella glacialis]|uniref:Uncharacterized protein n=1 Tax=Polarella glacialis TaxID=89957 RepID=A0A813F7C1_POLGL|nr:unnamed protein product [Polarella glacialis]CAE8695305.1 unnamed protein product [Polarella glacialis]|mmetsp:Transcript_12083/g.21846  ORF Transcript_12083/g.21846 Transcript_12083/m.21846 type:complete len:467 (+) Transcript_12083:97-1497(+)
MAPVGFHCAASSALTPVCLQAQPASTQLARRRGRAPGALVAPCGPKGLWSLSAALIVLVSAHSACCGSAADLEDPGEPQSACTLASLVLHSHGRPIDMDPPFQPHVLSYTATMDWSMGTFSVNVRPDTGCEDDGVPAEPTAVQMGGSTTMTIFARHPATGAKQGYNVQVSRLLGSETELQHLSVEGGDMSPIFDPSVRSYSVRADISYDVANIVYRLSDNEQRIRCSAQEEKPMLQASTASRLLQSHLEAANSSLDLRPDRARRLLANQRGNSGEVQFQDAASSFMLDIGFTRTVELTVQCADATQASIGTYTLTIARPDCIPATPFFEPKTRRCVNFCPSGFYRNAEAKRCSQCNTNCEVCAGLLTCHMCRPNTADYSYVIQPDGKCKAIVNHIFKKYLWWCVGLGVLLAFLLLIGCVGICQFCCSGPTSKSGGPRLYDSDSDDGPPRGKHLAPAQAQTRKLGMY